MGSFGADDRSFLEAALKYAHEAYRANNVLSMKSHHEVRFHLVCNLLGLPNVPRLANTCPAAILGQSYTPRHFP